MLTQISPVETPLHRWPAGLKLGLMALASTALFLLQGWAFLAAVLQPRRQATSRVTEPLFRQLITRPQ